MLLLLHRGEAMSTDRLVDALWGERAPPAAVKTVQTYVSQLRKALGDGVLATRAHAYVLERDAGTVDAERYRYDPRSGALSVVAEGLDKPNGLAFSPREDVLYVGDNGNPHHMLPSTLYTAVASRAGAFSP